MNEPLVFLPGMMCDARLFQPQIESLSSSHPIMVMPLSGKNTIEELAQDILDNTPKHFALLGLSMGGIVAMEIVRQAPDRVSRLALLDTNPMADTPERKELRDQQIERVEGGELRLIMRDEMKPNYLAQGEHKTDILELCMNMANDLGPEVFIQQSKALKNRIDQCETLKDVKVPTLILCGEHDTLCPLEKHQLMQSLIPNSKLSIISGAGHLPTLEQADLVNHDLRLWLRMRFIRESMNR